MLFHLFFSLLYICILISIFPIDEIESEKRGDENQAENVDFLRVRLRLNFASFFCCSLLLLCYFSSFPCIFLGQKFVFIPAILYFCFPAVAVAFAPYIRFVFVPFVTKVSINHHQPHAFDLVVIVVAVAVLGRNWFRYCCAVCRVPCAV